MNIKIYNFFSYWMAVWFILLKLKLIPYSPYLIYFCVAYGITLKTVYEYTLLIKNKTNVGGLLHVPCTHTHNTHTHLIAHQKN